MKRWIFSVLVFALAGCALRETAPELVGVELSPSAIEKTLTFLNSQRERTKDLKTLVRVRLEAGGEKNSFRYAIVYRRPSALRIETYPLNGFFTLSTLGVINESLTTVVHNEGVVFTATPSRGVFERILGLPLTVDEIASLLSADPILSGAKIRGIQEGLIERYISNDKRAYFEVSAGSSEVSRIKLFDEDHKILAEAVYSDYKIVDGVSFPFHISLRIVEADVHADLRIQKMQINTAPSDALFSIEIPEGFSTKMLE